MKLPVYNCQRHGTPECPDKGGTPSPGQCQLVCTVRLPIDDGPAVTWREVDDPTFDYPALWHRIHTHAASPAVTGESLRKLVLSVPCGPCKVHALACLAAHPIVGDAFEWAWALHEAVNARLGKSGVTLGEARALYAQRRD